MDLINIKLTPENFNLNLGPTKFYVFASHKEKGYKYNDDSEMSNVQATRPKKKKKKKLRLSAKRKHII